LSEKTFHVDDKVYEFYKSVTKKNAEKEIQWQALYKDYAEKNPKLAEQFENLMKGNFVDLENVVPTFKTTDKPVGTRKISGTVLNKIAEVVPELIGGSADLAGSNITDLTFSKSFQKGSYEGRNIHFGVREHAMAAIANGMRAHSNYIPYVATFLNFMGYLAGASRLSALSHFQVLYIMTHDSIGLGEDGPTHQPVRTLSLIKRLKR
jgi:transketolase